LVRKQILVQKTDGTILGFLDFSRTWLYIAIDDFEQSRLAGTVKSDQSDFVFRFDMESGVFVKRPASDKVREIIN